MELDMSFGVNNVVLGPGAGRFVPVPGQPHTHKAGADDTRGAYALLETVLTGQGPPQHIHHAEEEAVYMLDGEIDIMVGEDTVRATPGSFVLVARGTAHTFWNVGLTPARLLVIVSPPGFEQMFDEVVGDSEIDPATFVERVTAVAHKYGLEIVGPPLG
jgi:mannose-6-phosphate isomerase-like protein (cupin superfamily)